MTASLPPFGLMGMSGYAQNNASKLDMNNIEWLGAATGDHLGEWRRCYFNRVGRTKIG